MSNETVFFILAGILVLIALVVSFGGLRFQKFPTTTPVLIGGTVAVAALVLATMTFAWKNAEDEQAHKAEELAAEAEENAEAGNQAEADEEEGSNAPEETSTTATTSTSTSESTTTIAGDPAEGAELFNSQGCSGCHTLAAAGSTGQTGPDLDGALKGQTAEFIKTSIIDPSAEIAEGYPPDVMPQNFGDSMSPEQIDSLVAYLVESTSGGSP